jgi:MerR family transcriptional regulator, copper efflux regulator
MADLLISQLADRTGIPATTLRFYESAGLLTPGRTPGGYRTYDQGALERLGFITAAKRLGLPLEEIAELLHVWAGGSCAQVRDSLRPRLAARITEAEQSASELAAFAATLRRAGEHLDALPDRDERCDPECVFLAAGPTADTKLLTLHRTRQDAEDQAWRNAPVACSLGGQDMDDRIQQWHDLLADADYVPIPDGMRITVSLELAAGVAEMAAAEQRCCPFFDFRLHLAGQRLHLEVRAPAEAASMLAALFSPPS